MTHLTFLIPVRHPENSRDWKETRRTLSETAKSIAAQDRDGWEAIVVANRGSDLPSLPANFRIEWVDLPPNPFHEKDSHDVRAFFDGLRSDKGRRLLEGLRAARNSTFVMPVDDDDYISRRISGFAKSNLTKNGWYIEQGYGLHETRMIPLRVPISNFWRQCGTCHIVRTEILYKIGNIDSPDKEFIQYVLGSHLFIKERLANAGFPLDELPFPGAVYRRGHVTSSIQDRRGLFRKYVLNRGLLQAPLENLRNFARMRPVDKTFRNEFMGSSG